MAEMSLESNGNEAGLSTSPGGGHGGEEID